MLLKRRKKTMSEDETSCRECGSGSQICADCNRIPTIDTTPTKTIEVVIKEAELTKVNAQPGDVLFFKFKGDDFMNDDVQRLGDRLKKLFPNNKVITMTLPNNHDVELTSVRENVTNEPEVVSDCSAPTSYCSGCNCGKKEFIEGNKK